MASNRVAIAEDKIDFIKKLTDSSESVFETMADCLSFAAVLGYKHGKHPSLKKKAKDPIQYNIFESRKYDTLFHLIAMNVENDAHILAADQNNKRIEIFEEFANGGLEILKNRILDSDDSLEPLLSIIQNESTLSTEGDQDTISLDLSQLKID